MRADFEGEATGDSTEALLWQALSLTRGLIHEMDDLEVELGEGVTRPMIEPLNRIDERIFFALFAFVPGMYDEDGERAMARDRHSHERFGDLSSRLGLAGTPAERIHQLLREIRRRIGIATIRLDAVTDLRHEVDRITQSPE